MKEETLRAGIIDHLRRAHFMDYAFLYGEDQEVYMAVYEEEPKYKTKKAVVDMYSGNLLYLDLETKIHVYRPGSSELRVGEFLYSSKDYK